MAERCSVCMKKLLSHLRCIHYCRCEKLFCATHMHQHKCSFDYGLENKQRCEKAFPKVIASKIIPI